MCSFWVHFHMAFILLVVGALPDAMVKRAMKKPESKVYRERLLELRSRMRGDVTTMAEGALREANQDHSAMPMHMADIGSDNFDQEFTLSLMANEGDTLGLIESALERIEKGHYGLCDECESTIPKTRLNAIPYTPFCVQCAEKMQG